MTRGRSARLGSEFGEAARTVRVMLWAEGSARACAGQLVCAAIERPQLDDDAIRLAQYHLQRNAAAALRITSRGGKNVKRIFQYVAVELQEFQSWIEK